MKRYYLSIIEGTGSFNDSFHPAVRDVRGSLDRMRFWSPEVPWPGAPCLVMIDAEQHGAYLTDARTSALPELGLDQSMSGLNNPTRTRFHSAVTDRGLVVDWPNNALFRVALTSIGNQIAPGFSADGFDADVMRIG